MKITFLSVGGGGAEGRNSGSVSLNIGLCRVYLVLYCRLWNLCHY